MTSHPRRLAGSIALSSAALLALAACASGPGSTVPAGATPVDGGTLTFAISVDSRCIDPQQVGNNDAIAIARQTVASLTTQDPETGEITPWLAESFEVNADATSFAFTLADGPTYADGTPIDAQSVKTNFEAIQALGAKATLGSTYLSGLSSIEVADPQHVTVNFDTPSAQFLQATSTFTLGLLAPATAGASQEARCAGDFIGSGPFSVESYTPDQEAVLAKRPGYDWAPASAGHQGEARLDTITFVVIPEAGNRTGSLQSGQIDATAGIAPTDLVLFEGDGYSTTNRANPGVVYNLYPNESTPKLADENVRVAISKAVDRAEITETLLGADDVEAQGVLSTTTPFFAKRAALEFDPEAAEALLEESGWELGDDGIREKDGERLAFSVTYWQSPKEVLELVQQQLRAVGIDLQLKFSTIADVQAAQTTGTEDFLYGNLTRADPDVLRTVFSARGTQGNNHRAASEVDDVLDAQAATADQAERQKLVDEAETLLIEQGHSIPVYQLSTTIVASDSVRELAFEASSRLDFYDAWIAE